MYILLNIRAYNRLNMDHLSATDYINQQQTLEEEARELMPWDPKQCTYELGPLKQQVYACRTHNNIGICYSCSIRCHTTCDIVELFSKRHFTCDCGTERDTRLDGKSDHVKCEIRENKESDIAGFDNNYGHNFEGLFCDCAKEYDPDSQTVMLQCVLGLECGEDWYHDHCIMGLTEDEANERDTEIKTEGVERTLKGFPDTESFDAFVCWKCVAKYSYYFKKILSSKLSDEIILTTIPHGKSIGGINSSNKREREDDFENDPSQFSVFLKADYSKILKQLKESVTDKNDKLYIFLDQLAPFLIEDEPLYEPPVEDDKNIFDIVSKSIQESMSRSDIAVGASALHRLQASLKDFLKPFADRGEVVKEEDIKSFFKSSG